MRPLVVYLDSNDFSNLSKAPLSPDLQSLHDRLLDLRDRGAITLRFSMVHVLEAAPTAHEHTH